MRNLFNRLIPLLVLGAMVSAYGFAEVQEAVQQEEPRAIAASAGEQRKISGTIRDRNGDRFTLRLSSSRFVNVRLTDVTQVREKKSNPFRRGKKFMADDLVAGLVVEVQGRVDNEGALVAEKVSLTNDDFKTAQAIDARVTPVEANGLRMSGQINELGAVSNAARGGAKAAQETADSAHSRIAALDEYEPARNVTVRFKVGSAVLSEEARRALDELALEAKDLKGFVIEVAGFASSEGSLTFNRRLSRQRAEAVTEYLAEEHDIPLRRIMTPAGYSVSHPIADNSTRTGRQENRRVEVRLMISRGITAQASAVTQNSH